MPAAGNNRPNIIIKATKPGEVAVALVELACAGFRNHQA